MRTGITYRFILIFLGILLLNACTERIEIELDSTYTRLAVYGEITTELKYQTISLSTTSGYFINQPAPVVSDASVEVLTDSTSIIFMEDSNTPGMYVSTLPFRGSAGQTYSLIISNVDTNKDNIPEKYHSSTTMPEIGSLDSIKISYFQSPFASGYQITMYALDPSSKEWYSFKLYKNGILLTDTLIKYSVQSDQFINGQYIYGLPVGFLSDGDSSETAIPGDIITFELNSITQDFYDFIISAQSEIFGSNPLFGGPPANVTTNIDNDGVGIFTATSFVSISDTIPE